MQYYLSWPRYTFRKDFQEKALQLLPSYKQTIPARPPAAGAPHRLQTAEFSSPVCYADVKGLREGFLDQEDLPG